MPLRSLKLKWAWQAPFLSHTLKILGKVIFFEDLQMILISFLEFFHYYKSLKRCTQAICPGVEESLLSVNGTSQNKIIKVAEFHMCLFISLLMLVLSEKSWNHVINMDYSQTMLVDFWLYFTLPMS